MAKPTKPKDLKPKAEGEAGAAPAAAASGGGGSALDIKFIILLVVMVLSSILGSAGSVYLMTSMLVTPEIQKIAKAGGGEAKEGEAKEGGEGGEESSREVGMNLELDEFMINLKSDPALGGNQYLKAKMALSIKPPDKENCYAKTEKASVDPTATPKGRPGVGKRLQLDPTIAMAPVIPILPGTPSPDAAKGRLLGGRVAGAAMPIDLSNSRRAQSVGRRIDFDPSLLAEEGGGGPPPCETEFKAAMGRFVPTIRDVINASLMKRTASQLASAEGQETLKDEIKEQLTQIMAPEYSVLRVNFQDFIIQK